MDSEIQKMSDIPAEEKAPGPIEEFINHQRRALEEAGKAIDALFPEPFKVHGEAARKEFLAGVKVLVDAAIDEMEKMSKKVEETQEEERPSSTGRTKVKVQVE
jgi:hypothetical protein